MEVISKCKIPKKQSKRENLSTHQGLTSAISRKRYTTLNSRKSSSNSRTSFRPERALPSGIGTQQKGVARKEDACTESLSRTSPLNGSTSSASGWRTLLIVDPTGTSLATGQEAPTQTPPSKRTLGACPPPLQRKWCLWQVRGLWTSAWQSAPREWASTLLRQQSEPVVTMSRQDNSLLMQNQGKPISATSTQRTISSTC